MDGSLDGSMDGKTVVDTDDPDTDDPDTDDPDAASDADSDTLAGRQTHRHTDRHRRCCCVFLCCVVWCC